METKRKRARPPKAAGQPGRVIDAHYVRPSKVRLVFADGFTGTWSFRRLALDMNNMRTTTIRVSNSGGSVEVTSKWNDTVELDGSSLRAAVDPKYADELEAAFVRLRGPIEGFKTNSRSLPRS